MLCESCKKEMNKRSRRKLNPKDDLTWQRFGRMRVIKLSETSDSKGGRMWDCICDCGVKKSVRARNLKSGTVLSCGCLRNERIKEAYWKEHAAIR